MVMKATKVTCKIMVCRHFGEDDKAWRPTHQDLMGHLRIKTGTVSRILKLSSSERAELVA
jgi:hypothetical protein